MNSAAASPSPKERDKVTSTLAARAALAGIQAEPLPSGRWVVLRDGCSASVLRNAAAVDLLLRAVGA